MNERVVCDFSGRVLSLRHQLTAEAVDLAIDALLRLDTKGVRPIHIYLGCRGGTIAEAVSLIDIAVAIQSPIEITMLGLVQGTALWMLLAAKRRRALPGTLIATDGVWSSSGTIGLGRSAADEAMANAMVEHLRYFGERMRPDLLAILDEARRTPRIYRAKEALEIGLIDSIEGQGRKGKP
ncbi:MAG TPA: ATP-dependent Clp protease proteolytic subunit [Luteolibacter sp.]